jgi:hypothetical protein
LRTTGSRPVSGAADTRDLRQSRVDTAAEAMLDSRQQNRPPGPNVRLRMGPQCAAPASTAMA